VEPQKKEGKKEKKTSGGFRFPTLHAKKEGKVGKHGNLDKARSDASQTISIKVGKTKVGEVKLLFRGGFQNAEARRCSRWVSDQRKKKRKTREGHPDRGTGNN